MSLREHGFHIPLKEQMLEAIRFGQLGRVDFSNQSHNTITELLHEFVYEDRLEKSEPTYVGVLYSDGSQARPFPLHCIARRGQIELSALHHIQPLRVALVSMRHLEMDSLVDMAWILNSDLPKQQTLADIDTFCYLQTRQQLRDMLADGPLRLYLYQTGFQPAVVGFYRALVEELLQRTGRSPVLEVTPYYYLRPMGYYRPGRSWN